MGSKQLYLCKPNHVVLGQMNGINTDTASLKKSMTGLWELTFEIDRYVDIDGKLEESTYYSSVSEHMELLYINEDEDERIYFVIDAEPSIALGNTNQEVKSVTAHSCECELQQKNLKNFKINCGVSDSQEYLVFEKDENGNVTKNNLNLKYISKDSQLPIEYIVLDNRNDIYLQRAYDQLINLDFELDADKKICNTDVADILKKLLKVVPRLQFDISYDDSGSGLQTITTYVYMTEGEVYLSQDKNFLMDGIKHLITFYGDDIYDGVQGLGYKHKFSLITLALENSRESAWSVNVDSLSDELAQTKWNFEIDTQDVYSFLTNTVANYAKIIMTFDRYNKKVGAIEVDKIGEDTGVLITMQNLANTVNIATSNTDGIKTKMYPTGGNELGILNVNFGNPYILNYDYFIDAKNEYGDYKYGNAGLNERYHIWKDNYDAKRVEYIELSRQYNQALLDKSELTNRVPNDGCKVDYTTYKFDELQDALQAYQNSIESIKSMYMTDYAVDQVYDTSGTIPTDYPMQTITYIDDTDNLPEGVTPINETMYWYDYYSFKASILPKVYESLKRWCETTELNGVVYLTNENGDSLGYRTLASITKDNIKYLEFGNPKYATEEDLLKSVDDWLYEWNLYGLDELNAKKKGWEACANALYNEAYVQHSDSEIVYTTIENYHDVVGLTISYPKPVSSSTSYTTVDYQNDDAKVTVEGLNNNLSRYLDYCSDDDTRMNGLTGRVGKGVIRQCEDAIADRMKEINILSDSMDDINTDRSELQAECSYDTYSDFTDEDRAILNSLTASTDYSNENIAIQTTDDIVTTIDLQEELYQDALNEHSKIAQAQYAFTSEMDNLFALEEFNPMVGQCKVGNYIYMQKSLYDDEYVKLRVVTLTYNPLEISQELAAEFSTMTKSLNGFSDFSFLLESMAGGSTGTSGSGSGSGSGSTLESDIAFSNAVLRALLSTTEFKDSVDDIITKNLVSDNGTFTALTAGNIVVNGGCLTTGQIKSTNYSSTTGSTLNLDDGTFSFGGGSLTYNNNALSVKGEINATSGSFSGNISSDATIIGGILQSTNYTFNSGSMINLNDGQFSFAGGKLIFDGTDMRLGNIGVDENSIYSAGGVVDISKFTYNSSTHLYSMNILLPAYTSHGSPITVNGTVYYDQQYNAVYLNTGTVKTDLSPIVMGTSYTAGSVDGGEISVHINDGYTYNIYLNSLGKTFIVFGDKKVLYYSIQLNIPVPTGYEELGVYIYKHIYNTQSNGLGSELILYSQSNEFDIALGQDTIDSSKLVSTVFNSSYDPNCHSNAFYISPDLITFGNALVYDVCTDILEISTLKSSLITTDSNNKSYGKFMYLDQATLKFEAYPINDEQTGATPSVEINSTEMLIQDDGNTTEYKSDGIYDKRYNKYAYGYNLINKYVYNNTTSSGSSVCIDSDGMFYRYSSSSKRYKENISTTLSEQLNPNKLYDLNICEFDYKNGYLSKNDKRYGSRFIGLIAEDIYEKYPIACDLNQDGLPESPNYNMLIAPMIKLIQEQHEDIERLKKKVGIDYETNV